MCTKAGSSWKKLDKKLSDMQHGETPHEHSEFRIKQIREDLDARYVRKLNLASKGQWCLLHDRPMPCKEEY